jgi:hypothetical protein
VNQFEARNRTLKVSRLVRQLSEMFALMNLYPERDGVEMAQVLRNAFGDAEWTQLAVQCGSPGASVTTRLAVLAWFVGQQKAKAS